MSLLFLSFEWYKLFAANDGYNNFRDIENLLKNSIFFDYFTNDIDIFSIGSYTFNIIFLTLEDYKSNFGILIFQIIGILVLYLQINTPVVNKKSFFLLMNPFVLTSFLSALRNSFAYFFILLGRRLSSVTFSLLLFLIAVFIHPSVFPVAILYLIPNKMILEFIRLTFFYRFILIVILLIFFFFFGHFLISISLKMDGYDRYSDMSRSYFGVVSIWFIFLWFSLKNSVNQSLSANDIRTLFVVAMMIGLSFSVVGYYRYWTFFILDIESIISRFSKLRQTIFFSIYFVMSFILFFLWA